MIKLIRLLKIFTIGAVSAGVPLWFAISHIELFITLCLGLIAATGIFAIGGFIALSNQTLYEWVNGKNE